MSGRLSTSSRSTSVKLQNSSAATLPTQPRRSTLKSRNVAEIHKAGELYFSNCETLR